MTGIQLPLALDRLVLPGSLHENSIGESQSRVFRVELRAGGNAYLKVSRSSYVAAEMQQEMAVLKWLEGKIDAPASLAFDLTGKEAFLLLSAIPGKNLAEALPEIGLSACVEIGAKYLRKIHSLALENCPFLRNLSRTLKMAGENMRAGLVDESDFDSARLGQSISGIHDDLNRLAEHIREDLVFTHGDYCFPNIICENGKISGVVDLSRAGVADRYQDISLFLRSLEFNADAAVDTALFLKHYGLIDRLDPEKIEFYRILDEFF